MKSVFTTSLLTSLLMVPVTTISTLVVQKYILTGQQELKEEEAKIELRKSNLAKFDADISRARLLINRIEDDERGLKTVTASEFKKVEFSADQKGRFDRINQNLNELWDLSLRLPSPILLAIMKARNYYFLVLAKRVMPEMRSQIKVEETLYKLKFEADLSAAIETYVSKGFSASK